MNVNTLKIIKVSVFCLKSVALRCCVLQAAKLHTNTVQLPEENMPMQVF